MPVWASVYLQGGIFLDFESHGQLRCCLLHRHLGFVVFLWLFVFFSSELRMASALTTAPCCHGVSTDGCAAWLEMFQRLNIRIYRENIVDSGGNTARDVHLVNVRLFLSPHHITRSLILILRKLRAILSFQSISPRASHCGERLVEIQRIRWTIKKSF